MEHTCTKAHPTPRTVTLRSLGSFGMGAVWRTRLFSSLIPYAADIWSPMISTVMSVPPWCTKLPYTDRACRAMMVSYIFNRNHYMLKIKFFFTIEQSRIFYNTAKKYWKLVNNYYLNGCEFSFKIFLNNSFGFGPNLPHALNLTPIHRSKKQIVSIKIIIVFNLKNKLVWLISKITY